MKKTIVFLAALLLFCVSAFCEDVMYVTSRNGLRVRSEPNLSSKTIDMLYYGEYALVDEFGKMATIDGITANWVRVKFYDDEEFPDKNGMGIRRIFGMRVEMTHGFVRD